MVQLEREPENAYDKNAIRVVNMAGSKVGHVKAAEAAALAPLMDEACAERAVSVEATVPREPQNKYELGAVVVLFGRWRAAPRVAALLLRKHKLALRNGVCALPPGSVFKRAEEVAMLISVLTSSIEKGCSDRGWSPAEARRRA